MGIRKIVVAINWPYVREVLIETLIVLALSMSLGLILVWLSNR